MNPIVWFTSLSKLSSRHAKQFSERNWTREVSFLIKHTRSMSENYHFKDGKMLEMKLDNNHCVQLKKIISFIRHGWTNILKFCETSLKQYSGYQNITFHFFQKRTWIKTKDKFHTKYLLLFHTTGVSIYLQLKEAFTQWNFFYHVLFTVFSNKEAFCWIYD